jgi:L-ribulokinase
VSDKYVIGLDYGTDSVRSLLLHAETGEQVASRVYQYERWREGRYCDAVKSQFRQHPLDYLAGLEQTVRGALADAPRGVAERVVGIAVDTTGSTPVAVDEAGTPLALRPEFAENPNAMFVLWKDHTAVEEADQINELARSFGGEDYTKYEGGVYSSEWFWAKILHVLRADEAVRRAAYSWVEHCDYIPAVLTGTTSPLTMKRSRCAAGHKAMWHASWGGLPPDEFLAKLDPLLAGLRQRLFRDTHTADVAAGTLTKEWADRLGLPQSVVVGAGAFDAHMGAVGGQIEPYFLSKVMGTSTCDMLVAPNAEVGDKLIRGICGQVDGSIIPGMLGMEAGQSAFGDVYAWFKRLVGWPVQALGASLGGLDGAKVDALLDAIIPSLEREASALAIGESGIVALDWMNGRRTPDANQKLRGAVLGLNLGSTAPMVYRALVEATAFGAKAIVDRFVSEGVPVKGVIALGGVAKKSPLVMQTVADVLGMPIKVVRSEQACALGAGMFAATAAGVYQSVEQAMAAMGSGFEKTYEPVAANVAAYEELYAAYRRYGELVEGEV